MLKQHGERFLGNYTYVDLYDLMGQVPDFPADVWRLVETKTIEPLGFVERRALRRRDEPLGGHRLLERPVEAAFDDITPEVTLLKFKPKKDSR